MQSDTILIAICATIAAGGVFYVFAYPYMSGQARAEKRQAALAPKGKDRKGNRNVDSTQRRKNVNDSLKELAARNSSRKITLESKIMQAGLDWSKQKFFIVSAVSGVLFGVLTVLLSGEILYAVPGAAVGAFGVPNWALSFLRKRRTSKFITEFPNAVDIIIRGIKAGLPVSDCLRIISNESMDPVRTEFRLIVEATSVGLSIGEAVDRLVERMPVPEANFFAIVISIQQSAGGNLSEALGNLSRVLRERKKMQAKVKAMSAEAKASAGIIGALPFLVSTGVYISSPRYIEILWLTSTGRFVMLICAFWMVTGVMMMKKMINFDM